MNTLVVVSSAWSMMLKSFLHTDTHTESEKFEKEREGGGGEKERKRSSCHHYLKGHHRPTDEAIKGFRNLQYWQLLKNSNGFHNKLSVLSTWIHVLVPTDIVSERHYTSPHIMCSFTCACERPISGRRGIQIQMHDWSSPYIAGCWMAEWCYILLEAVFS